MNTRFRWVAVGMTSIGIFAVAAVASAAGISSGPPASPPGQPTVGAEPVIPPPNPAPKSGPAIWIYARNNNSSLGSYAFPYDFNFTDKLAGYGFRPGEQVTISVRNVSAKPAVVTADNDGAFTTEIDFSWVFCGANATRTPPPIFTATGNAGSHAELTEDAPPCPDLVAQAPMPRTRPLPGGSVGVVGAGTAVVATAQVVGTAVSGPGTSGGLATAGPAPAPRPRVVKLTVQGFGFASGESVTITESGYAPYPASAPIHAVADSQGRLETPLQTYAPPLCGAWPSPPMIVATGNHGTTVVAHLVIPVPMVACPVVAPPGDGTNPPKPAPNQSVPIASVLALSLHPFTVHRGGLERATIQSDTSGAVTMTVRYPGRRTARYHGTIGKTSATILHWRVPRTIKPGRARVHLSLAKSHIAVSTGFVVR